MTPQRMEDFTEWAVGVEPGALSGTGWAPAPGANQEPLIAANANYFSGRSLRWSPSSSAPSQLTIDPPAVGTTQCFSFGALRESNATIADNLNGGVGWRFQIGANSFRIVCGSTTVGAGDTYILQSIIGSTVTELCRTPNNIPTGVKTPLALHFDPTLGTWSFYVALTLIASGNIPTFVGGIITLLTYGRLGTGAITNTCNMGDFFYYSNGAYVGPREVRTGYATANDTNQDWSFVGGASAWESINNGLINPPTQYIESGAAGQISDFDTPVSTTNVFGISAMEIRGYVTRTDIALISVDLRYGDATTFFNGVAQIPPQLTYQLLRQAFEVNPNTGLGFTVSDMANARWGVERN